MKSVLGLCLDRRVLLGLAVVALGIWTVAPQALGAALPFLLIAVCPLSMLLMARMMPGGMGMGEAKPTDPGVRLRALEQEQARLEVEIARARTDLGAGKRDPATRSELREVQR